MQQLVCVCGGSQWERWVSKWSSSTDVLLRNGLSPSTDIHCTDCQDIWALKASTSHKGSPQSCQESPHSCGNPWLTSIFFFVAPVRIGCGSAQISPVWPPVLCMGMATTSLLMGSATASVGTASTHYCRYAWLAASPVDTHSPMYSLPFLVP